MINEFIKFKSIENKAYYEKNRSSILDNKKKYYERNRQEILEKKKLRYKMNKIERQQV